MCLILLAVEARADLPLIIAANRDEFYARPTAPAGRWEDAPHVLGGRDLLQGGSWLGITENGRWAAVTNFREPASERADTPSRGALVRDFLLGAEPPAEYTRRLRLNGGAYNGFNLLVGDPAEVRWFSNRGGDHPLHDRSLAPGVYGLSNHLLDTPWPKVARGKMAMERAIASGAAPERLLEILLDRTLAEDADLPSTGVPTDLERALSAAFIAGTNYGTRCSTVIERSSAGHITLLERSYAPPDRVTLVREEMEVTP